jgi:hypothetical protein
MKIETLHDDVHRVLIEPSDGLLVRSRGGKGRMVPKGEKLNGEDVFCWVGEYRLRDDILLWLMEQGVAPYCTTLQDGVEIIFESNAETLKLFENACVLYRIGGTGGASLIMAMELAEVSMPVVAPITEDVFPLPDA